MRWQRIIRIIPAVSDLVHGQLELYRQQKSELQADIDSVTAYPDTRIVHVAGGTMSKTDWLADASTAMGELGTQIAKLESY